jgi:murein DD-endopeptidase MepM/ murein hydrolase activator NlpD
MKRISAIVLLLACLLPSAALAARTSPVDGGVLTSGPGLRLDPFGSGRTVMHNGWDIAVPVGTPVHPTQEGTVYFAGPYRGYGNLVAIQHGQGYITLYGHNAELLVKPGDYVTPATVIARSGNSGRSTGPHLHYEVRQLPASYRQQRQAELASRLKEAVSEQVGTLVDNYATGKGGPEQETSLLPADIDR